MKHKKNKHKGKGIKEDPGPYNPPHSESYGPKLEIVLKCDSTGSVEAISEAISKIELDGLEIEIISSGVGDINHSDLMMADTGGKLILGFEVDLLTGIVEELKEYGIEVRLYNIIYKLTDDLHNIARSMLTTEAKEDVMGTAEVIKIFKSTRKGIIAGCEITDGHLSVGQKFRVISAMGPVYSGSIESIHIESSTVQKANRGQQVGIKISDFKNIKVGDIIESYKAIKGGKARPWKPENGVIRIS